MKSFVNQNVVFIINSLRKLPKNLASFLDELPQKSIFNSCLCHYTKYAGHALELAYVSSNQNVDLIVSVGGDGTFNEVVNGILNSENKNTLLALIPNGTGNDFCRGQKIIFNTEKFIAGCKENQYKLYDVGQILIGEKMKYFLNIADFGFGGHTAKILNDQRNKGLIGGLSYSVAILRSFFSFRKPIVKITADDLMIYDGKLMMLAICNGDTFGNGLIIHPGAKPDDGLLNITLLGEVTLLDYIYHYFKLKKGIKIIHHGVKYQEAINIELDIVKGRVPAETDGEIFTEGNASISVLPSALKVLKY